MYGFLAITCYTDENQDISPFVYTDTDANHICMGFHYGRLVRRGWVETRGRRCLNLKNVLENLPSRD